MNNRMASKLLALLMLTAMLFTTAFAENMGTEGQPVPGNLPERGLVLSMTPEDQTKLQLTAIPQVIANQDIAEIPAVAVVFADIESAQKVMDGLDEQELLEDKDLFAWMMQQILSHTHAMYGIALFEEDYYDQRISEGKVPGDLTGLENTVFLGENDGYVYVGFDYYEELMEIMQSDTQKAAARAAIDRCKELIAGMSYQPVVFRKGEFTQAPDAVPSFSTVDLQGNTVTNQIFLGKKLTVLNIWGTTCGICIDEMPYLAQWSQEMPEGVQLVGLVSDITSADDAEMMEIAKYICQVTGADAYTNPIVDEGLARLLSGVVGTPTTFFVDGKGNLVGNPVVGSNVAACKAFVESYLAG